jgi:hypothetical protein
VYLLEAITGSGTIVLQTPSAQTLTAGYTAYSYDLTNTGFLIGNKSDYLLMSNSSGYVGINTITPGASLHVAGLIPTSPIGLGVFSGIDVNGNACIQLNSGTVSTKSSFIDFGYSGVDFLGRILYTNSTNVLDFSTNSVSRMSISGTGILNLTGTTSSTSNTTGIVTLAGGFGISNTTDATSSTNGGTITTAGGVAIAKKLFIGTDLSVGGTSTLGTTTATSLNNTPVGNTTASTGAFTTLTASGLITANSGLTILNGQTLNVGTSGTTSSLQVFGSATIVSGQTLSVGTSGTTSSLQVFGSATIVSGQTLSVGTSGTASSLQLFGSENITGTTASTTNTTGALTIAGGIGISNVTDATSSTNGGTITTAGGVAIAKKLFVGTDLSIIGTISGTNTASITSNNDNVLSIDTGTRTSNCTVARFLAPALSAASYTSLTVGVAQTTNNAFEARFYNVGSGLGTNYISFAPLLGTQVLNILANGNVGIGTTSAGAALHVAGSIPVTPTGNGVFAGIDVAANSTIQINSGSSGVGSALIDFGYSGIDFMGRIIYSNVTNTFSFATNGSIKMTLSDTGVLGVTTLSVSGTTTLAATSHSGITTVTNTTTSTSNSTGALVISGGLGISNTTDATSSTNGGTITTAGGAAIAKKLYIGTDLIVTGAISKGSGTFDIPHPIVKNKRLIHSFIEGPRCDLIYRGTVKLVNGTAQVNLDKDCTDHVDNSMTLGTFEVLCCNPVKYLHNNDSFDRIKGSVSGNILSITCENIESDASIDWMVIAERKDTFIKTWNKTDSVGALTTEYSVE